MKRWAPGTLVYHDDLWRGHLLNVFPVTVVRDEPGLLALYSMAGSTMLSGQIRDRPSVPLAERIRIFAEVVPKPEPWPIRSHRLQLYTPKQRSSVMLNWRADWEFLSWYVNMEPPYRRTAEGIVGGDYLLDIVVTPDFQWQWKDQDEFDAYCAAGHYSPRLHASVLHEASRMVEYIERRQPPFSDPWPEWRPDPEWPVPHVALGEDDRRRLTFTRPSRSAWAAR